MKPLERQIYIEVIKEQRALVIISKIITFNDVFHAWPLVLFSEIISHTSQVTVHFNYHNF